jgi:uncharacterized membrane protein
MLNFIKIFIQSILIAILLAGCLNDKPTMEESISKVQKNTSDRVMDHTKNVHRILSDYVKYIETGEHPLTEKDEDSLFAYTVAYSSNEDYLNDTEKELTQYVLDMIDTKERHETDTDERDKKIRLDALKEMLDKIAPFINRTIGTYL